jgi:redox-sensitive bicupin YhaK (pirin superfamily)
VLHSEMFITDKDKPTHFDGFQIWLNLPAKLKMSEPAYQMLWKNDVPVVDIRDEATNKNVNIKIIAGKVGDKQAKIEKSVPLSFLHVKIDPNHEWNFNIPKEHNNFLYIIKGEAIFDDTKVSNQSYVLMGHDSDTFSVKSGNGMCYYAL